MSLMSCSICPTTYVSHSEDDFVTQQVVSDVLKRCYDREKFSPRGAVGPSFFVCR